MINSRIVFLMVLFALIWMTLIFRLFILQAVQHNRYYQRAEHNRTLIIDQMPARGRIYDRYGKLIVDNQPVFKIVANLKLFDSADVNQVNFLAGLAGLTVKQTREQLRQTPLDDRVTVKDYADMQQISRLEEHRLLYPGIEHQVDIRRVYREGLTMPHIIGYMSQITENRLSYFQTSDYADADYKIGEYAGASGLEKFYDMELRGQKGHHLFEVDAAQNITRDLGVVRRPHDGYHLYLTVDLEYQRYLELILSGYRGAIVAIDVRTGEIIAAASKPDFNVKWFADGITTEQWKALNENPNNPLFNRLIHSGYPPASTFKMVTAIAGLEEGVVTPETYFACKGVFELGGNKFRCWNLNGHGGVDMRYAITQSCDIYFYNLAWRLGINRLAKYGRMFGFGELSGVDLPGERKGVMPTTDYFDRRYGRDNWKAGTVVNLGIGQGEILVNPVQLAQYCVILANRGFYYPPHFVRLAEDESGIRKIVYPAKQVPVKIEHIELMRYAMFTVVNSYAGTGKRAAIKASVIAGKTGTAQNVHGHHHSLFVAFAPYYNPEIAIATILENAGEGSEKAAPLSGMALSYYFKNIRGKKPFDPLEQKQKIFQTLTANQPQ